MQGLNKTKAALQGRQCNYRKIKPSQITTLIDQVNNLGRVANMQLGIGMQKGQAKRCDKKCIGHKLTAPLAQLIRDVRISAHTVPNYGELTVIPSAILRPLILLVFSQSKSFASWWVYPNLDRPDMSDSPQWGTSTPMADTLRNSGLAEGEIPPSKQNHRAIVQPFGSMLEQSTNLPKPLDSGSGHNLTSPETSPFTHVMPALPKYKTVKTQAIKSNLFSILCKLLFSPQPFSSIPSRSKRWRQESLTQELNCPLPAAFSICSSNSSSKRIIFLVLPERSVLFFEFLSCIGSYRYVRLDLDGMNHFIGDYHKKQRPGVFAALPRRFTKPLYEVTIMADIQSTQTRPKYQYRFLALHRSDRSAAPCRLSVEAFTEKEARQVLSAHFILSLAARLPVREVRHA